MGNTGLFFPIIVIFLVAGTIILCLIERMLEPKEAYEKWLEKELERNPDYINWLKHVSGGKDYQLGLQVLAKVKRDKSSSCYKWLKIMRRIGKY